MIICENCKHKPVIDDGQYCKECEAKRMDKDKKRNTELIVKIDEEVYKKAKETHDVMCDSVWLAIKYGVPLPKGHGRLIDADYLREDFKASKKISFAERMNISCIVDYAPTIIEADKESEDNV